MLIILIILCVILVAYLVYTMAEAESMEMHLTEHLDSYETYDPMAGRKITPYHAVGADNDRDYRTVTGRVHFRSNFIRPLNPTVYVGLGARVEVPFGYELVVSTRQGEGYVGASGSSPIPIRLSKDDTFTFYVELRAKGYGDPIPEPQRVRFVLEARWGTSKDVQARVDYEFLIGPDLENVWVGFDPGTSGSCVSVGGRSENIVLSGGPLGNITPSLVAFDTKHAYVAGSEPVPDKDYTYGHTANRYTLNTQYVLFSSIKKLLGFKDIKTVRFTHQEALNLTGQDLASMLVKGLYADLERYVEGLGAAGDPYRSQGRFNPKRAVIAIPNNYTFNKTQAIKSCVQKLGQFKEVRTVSEAEAVLFYYLSEKFDRFRPNDEGYENVFIFDMGGATINATVASIQQVEGGEHYHIDVLGKIGYSVGGDSIDYSIIKFLQSFPGEFLSLSALDIHTRKKELADVAFKIKKEIIYNYDNGNGHLILASTLEDLINKGLGLKIKVDAGSPMYAYFLREAESGKYPLFNHAIFQEVVYKNVADATREVLALAQAISIEKIIFSGRSTFFPLIREVVEHETRLRAKGAESIQFSEEISKEVVARGACWYGLNKNTIRLRNTRTNAAFGFKHRTGPGSQSLVFKEWIPIGATFRYTGTDVAEIKKEELFESNFNYTNNRVEFYQVMGANGTELLAKGQKQKFSFITDIEVKEPTKAIMMSVKANDWLQCGVFFAGNEPIFRNGSVSDRDVSDDNDDHYTWIL